MQAALDGAETVVFQGTERQRRVSARAHLVLPSAAYVEREGTFTNFEGRVQRFRTARRRRSGDAWPDWMILSFVGRALGVPGPGRSRAERAEQVFQALAGRGAGLRRHDATARSAMRAPMVKA